MVHAEALAAVVHPAPNSKLVILQQSVDALQLLEGDEADSDAEQIVIDSEILAAQGVSVIVSEPFYFKIQSLQTWTFVNFWLKANAVARKFMGFAACCIAVIVA